MTCKHEQRLPNPAGGAWFCAWCGAYPLICTPETKASLTDAAAALQSAWKERDAATEEALYQRKMRTAFREDVVL